MDFIIEWLKARVGRRKSFILFAVLIILAQLLTLFSILLTYYSYDVLVRHIVTAYDKCVGRDFACALPLKFFDPYLNRLASGIEPLQLFSSLSDINTNFFKYIYGLCVTFIGFAVFQARKVKGWHGTFYTAALVCFLLCLGIFHYARSIIIDSVVGDAVYFQDAFRKDARGGEVGLPIIVEPIIESSSDLHDFKNTIWNGKVKNIFLTSQCLRVLERNNLLYEFLAFIVQTKKKDKFLKLYADIEFHFRDISFLDQMALASSHSSDFIYSCTLDAATRLRKDFHIDYVFGPVLDRRLSYLDKTIGTRSFGQDLAVIDQAALAVILAFHNAGITCVPKHFPGHPQHTEKNTDPHFRLMSTKYCDENLNSNASPFNFVINQPFLKTKMLMTDHIIIPSVSDDMPYSIFSTGDPRHSGVIAVFDKLSGADYDDMLLISDDLLMFISTALENKRQTITETTLVNINDLQPVVRNVLDYDLKHVAGMNIVGQHKMRAVDVLACLTRRSLLAGHSMALVRGLNINAINVLVNRMSEILNSDLSLNNYIRDQNPKIEDILSQVPSELNIHTSDSIDIKSSPFLKLSMKSSLDDLKRSAFSNFDIFYISSCEMRDDLGAVFGRTDICMDTLSLCGANAFSNYYLKKNIGALQRSLQLHLEQNNKYKYYIAVIGHDALGPCIDTIYNFLLRENKTEKFIILIAETPDFLFSIYPMYMKTEPLELLHNANVYCVYSNTVAVRDMLTKFFSNQNFGFKTFANISRTTIDIPNYYNMDLRESLFPSDSMFYRIYVGATKSQLYSHRFVLNLLFHFMFILTALSFSSAIIGIIIHYYAHKKFSKPIK